MLVKINQFLHKYMFVGAVTTLTKLDFKYQGLCLNQQLPVWNMVRFTCRYDARWN